MYGEKNPILGNIVYAKIQLEKNNNDNMNIDNDIKSFCTKYLERYKVPVKIFIIDEELHTDRFKKKRN